MNCRGFSLIVLKLDEININEWYMVAGMKTDAGKQRIVPIHEKIKALVKDNYSKASGLEQDICSTIRVRLILVHTS